MNLSPTERLFLSCVCVQRDENKIDFLLAQKIDWENLIGIASAHRALPLLSHNLKTRPIPDEIRLRLKSFYRSNLIRNLQIEAEQNKIFQLLARHKIDVVPLKGIFFAKFIYGDIGLRCGSDIDIFVKEADLYRTREILSNLGFASSRNYSDDYWLADSCHFPLSNGRFSVEIHWNLVPFNNFRVSCPQIWPEVKNINGQTMLSLEMQAVFIVLKFVSDSFNNLKYLIDLMNFISRYGSEINWLRVSELLNLYRINKSWLFSMHLIQSFWPGLPNLDRAQISNPLVWDALLFKLFPKKKILNKPVYQYIWRLIWLDNWKDAIPLIYFYFFPHPKKLEPRRFKNMV